MATAPQPHSRSETASSPPKDRRRIFFLWAAPAVVLLAGLGIWLIMGNREANNQPPPPRDKDSTPLSFTGSSDRLDQTVLVPTLESPLPAGKSAFWCGTLPLAWQEFEKEVAKGPVVLTGAENISRSLSREKVFGLPARDYYVAAGFYRDGILDRIRRELPAKFPRAPLPGPRPSPQNKALAYAYLEVAVPFRFEFKDSKKPLLFKDGRGRQTAVRAFGIPEKDEEGEDTYRSQVRVLFNEGEEFALDLSKNTRPYQVILARLKKPATLRAALESLKKKTAAAGAKKKDAALNEEDSLLVPIMHWRIDHRFRELENKKFLDSSLPPDAILDKVFQFIEFKMDRRGATVSSGAMVNEWEDGNPERHFHFDQPFLVLLQVRKGGSPLFVMWVDNAELLQPQQ